MIPPEAKKEILRFVDEILEGTTVAAAGIGRARGTKTDQRGRAARPLLRVLSYALYRKLHFCCLLQKVELGPGGFHLRLHAF